MELDSRAITGTGPAPIAPPLPADSTAPWPPALPEDSDSFRFLRPGELLAIPVPTAALQLDAQLRHLEIDGEFGDWPAASIHLAQARATWQQLEPALTRRLDELAHLRGARKAASDMGRSIERAAEAVAQADSTKVVKIARKAIALVDAIERVFE